MYNASHFDCRMALRRLAITKLASGGLTPDKWDMENQLDSAVNSDFNHCGYASRKSIRRLCTYLYLLAAFWMIAALAICLAAALGWGKGQEDVMPVAQFEKLWGDMTSLAEFPCRFVAVPRKRGQQLKEPAQLDGWLRDGSAAFVESLCDWGTEN